MVAAGGPASWPIPGPPFAYRDHVPSKAAKTRRRRSTLLRPRRRLVAGLAALLLVTAAVPRGRARLASVAAAASGAVAMSRLSSARLALRYANHYGISFELAAAIQAASVAEGIDPALAFRLVRIESGFRPGAISSAGALGLTQLMPATAAALEPGITRARILERETNLRLGFRYLRWLIRVHDGDLEEALHAYNRGPGTVARIRAGGGDPANGYAALILNARRHPGPYRGAGLLPLPAAP